MESLLTPLMSLIESVCSSVAKRVNHLKDFKHRMERMAIRLEELKEARDDLKREIEQAELQLGEWMSTEQVKGWLERAEKTEVETNMMLSQPAVATLTQGGMCCKQSTPGLCSARYKLSKKALQKEAEINELITKRGSVDVLVQHSSRVHPIPCVPTIGLNASLEIALHTIIADDGCGIIGIYGISGVGKTTLLKQINNECVSRSNEFEAVIWVTVSNDFSPERIRHALISRLGLSFDATESQYHLTSRIYNFMRRIKFLLLLDDLWGRLDLAELGIPLPDKSNKCKVVFTTPSMDICSDMDADKKLKVDFLNEEHSWTLFCQKVGEADIRNSDIKPYAEAIIKRCGGLPLVLITVGRAMANRHTVEEWRYAVEVLENAPSEFRGMQHVFSILKFTYDNLQDATLKMCFLYCALFPEEYPLEKQQLIDYWIGEGFLDGSNEYSLHNKGHAIISSLKVACLLESGEEETQLRMHDIVRSFALWIASNQGNNKNKVVVQACTGLIELPCAEKWKEAERISLLDNELTMLSSVPVCPNLSSLLLHWNRSLTKISNEFFQYMPVLKVLDLSVTSIREIPASIGKLVELRHLDLSRTKIDALPKELGCLSNLRHLDLQRTHSLGRIPREAILGLQNLRVLNLYYSYSEWEMSHGSEVEQRLTFLNLQNLMHLTALGITMTEFSSLTKLTCFHGIVGCIQYLCIKGCEGLIYLMVATVYGGGERLRRLNISECSTLKEIDMGSEVGKDWLPSLEVVSLHNLPNLTTIWRNSVSSKCHRNLRYINIWYCHKLKNISWILQLPRLEKLYVFYCDEIEEIIGENDTTEGPLEMVFPSLKTISFRGLPKLRSISKVAISFPMLNTIAVIDCPQLKKLPSKGYDSQDVPIVYCGREWWESLEWDDVAAVSSALHPQFIAV